MVKQKQASPIWKHLLFSIIRMRARTICTCNKKAVKKRQNKHIENMSP